MRRLDLSVWGWARGVALAGFGVTLLSLATGPGWLGSLLWRGIVPLLPLVFLVHPGIWRNVCPLATLGSGRITADPDRGAPPVLPSVVALLILLPLRPTVFEASGLASAGVLLAVGGTAFWAGGRATGKAGFCNRLCPILPLERLYGQSPLIKVGNARCGDCNLCAPIGCLDLNPITAVAQVLGGSRHHSWWTRSPFGAFAAGFPGVILAFYQLPTPVSTPGVYLQLALGGALSWVAVSLAVRLTGLGWRRGLVLLGGLSAGLHLWFALPGMAEVWGLRFPSLPLHLLGLGIAVVWTAIALRQQGRRLVQIN